MLGPVELKQTLLRANIDHRRRLEWMRVNTTWQISRSHSPADFNEASLLFNAKSLQIRISKTAICRVFSMRERFVLRANVDLPRPPRTIQTLPGSLKHFTIALGSVRIRLYQSINDFSEQGFPTLFKNKIKSNLN